MRDRLCMRCMNNFDRRYDVCPYCGTIVGMPPLKDHHIRPGTLLRGRYVLGYALRDKGNILYSGYDLKYSARVLIEECYDSRYMDRASDGQGLFFFPEGSPAFSAILSARRRIVQRMIRLRLDYGIGYHLKCIPENDTLYIVTRSMAGRSLESFLRSLPDSRMPFHTALPLFVKVLERVRLLHSAGIVHGYLCPENVFLEADGSVKILALEQTQDDRSPRRGRPPYSALEQYSREPVIGQRTDVYALAAIFYRMLTGKEPPDAVSRFRQAQALSFSRSGFSIPRGSEIALFNALRLDQTERTPTITQFMRHLLTAQTYTWQNNGQTYTGPQATQNCTGPRSAQDRAGQRAAQGRTDRQTTQGHAAQQTTQSHTTRQATQSNAWQQTAQSNTWHQASAGQQTTQKHAGQQAAQSNTWQQTAQKHAGQPSARDHGTQQTSRSYASLLADKLCVNCMRPYEKSQYRYCPSCGYDPRSTDTHPDCITPGTVVAGHYLIGRQIGRGAFGITYIGYDLSRDLRLAVKEYMPKDIAERDEYTTIVNTKDTTDPRMLQQFDYGRQLVLKEAQLLQKFANVPEVVQVFDCLRANNTVYIAMEYLEGETLKARLDRVRVLPVEEACPILRMVLQGLKAVHVHDLIHRDVAPDNIFLTEDGKVKLLDFGAARYATLTAGQSAHIILKPGYAPPEQYSHTGHLGPWTDVYAAAATFYQMVSGIRPPESTARAKNDTLRSLTALQVSIAPKLEQAVMKALRLRYQERTPSADSFIRELDQGMEQQKSIFFKVRQKGRQRSPSAARGSDSPTIKPTVLDGSAADMPTQVYGDSFFQDIPTQIHTDIW